MSLHHELFLTQTGLDRVHVQRDAAVARIIVHGAMPPPKELCPKAKARGMPCTTDQCDHSGGFLLLSFSDGTGGIDRNQGPCKVCGADPDQSPLFDELRGLP